MTQLQTKTVGEALIDLLEVNEVEVVFGIPGVHTVELYRGLATSKIRHVTPRHEQGCGFMADGYARVSGKPGVCLVITGPGLTNTITAMAQARADSIPMLVISGVNARDTLGKGLGKLHELPDQHAMLKTLALSSQTLHDPADLAEVIEKAFTVLGSGRPGPVHIEIPTDVMSVQIPMPVLRKANAVPPETSVDMISRAVQMCAKSVRPVILAGGGATAANAELGQLATRLDAPVISTINGRGLLAGNPLCIPASPSLEPVRALLAQADLVLAIGTQMGPTDYDMYVDGKFPTLEKLIRIDIDRAQLDRGPKADLSILSTAQPACRKLADALPTEPQDRQGSARAAATRTATIEYLSPKLQSEIEFIATIQRALPGCIMVGDSTQPVYAGNLYCEIDRVNGWFNAATGYGALGYSLPAAIGASLAAPEVAVVCIVGDGGIQFTLSELGSAMDEKTPIIVIVWNNDGYREIETYMRDNDITPIGVKPSAPDFMLIAQAYGLNGIRLGKISQLSEVLVKTALSGKPTLVEIHQP
jgi:acetolactate synthase I/II/III large subunit